MPYDDPDPSDPTELIGVEFEAERAVLKEMAYTFAEEFAGLGHSGERLHRMFSNPTYASAHSAYLALGDAEIRRIIQECLDYFSGFRTVVEDAPDEELVTIGGLKSQQAGEL